MSAAIRQPASQPAQVGQASRILQSSESVRPLPGCYPNAEIVKSSANRPVNDDLVRAIDDKRPVEFVL